MERRERNNLLYNLQITNFNDAWPINKKSET
jgi:hypothetical protein